MMGLRVTQPTSEIKALRYAVLYHMILMRGQPVLVLALARMSYSGASSLTMRNALQLKVGLFRLDTG
eukprot:10523722-Karenia_brevis.AAC.1